MNAALGTLRRRERELFARRRKAEGRASRERMRNSRLALAGFVLLGAAITFGVRTSWAPAPIRITSMSLPKDAESLRFAENHLGRLFFDSLDDAICREMLFNNDTGRFSNEKPVRCDEEALRAGFRPPATDLRARGFSLSNGFSSR